MVSAPALLLGLLLTLAPASASTAEALTFGVVPQQAASKLARLWGPFLREVGQRSGVRLEFRTAPDIPTFEKRLASGRYDLAYMNPYHYTVFHRDPGYVAFAKERGKRIHGILVVRKDSPLQDPAGLRGQTLAFPAPAAFAASVLTRAHLRRAGIPFQARYVSSHDSVYRAVAKGLFPAGGGVVRTFNNVAPAIRDQLRILWRTEGFTPHAFAAHPRLAPEVRRRVQQALVDMGDASKGRRLLGELGFNRLEPATDTDWDDVRGLGIDLLRDLVGD
ncbi:MAG TPA: phosphate/phosphite/phosphonate ABC transporter substrate-binding protein [Gammaproteobacteria bacterium]|nr:phosphate/phosphite/phosphonate ABC transporter substrate-binding protein [Gammaproteobacteria bacterium]